MRIHCGEAACHHLASMIENLQHFLPGDVSREKLMHSAALELMVDCYHHRTTCALHLIATAVKDKLAAQLHQMIEFKKQNSPKMEYLCGGDTERRGKKDERFGL